MATRMEIFITLTIYLIVATIMTSLITSSLLTYKYDVSNKYTLNNSEDMSTVQSNGLRQNAMIIWDLITLSYDTVGLPSVILFFIFLTIPTIIWTILLATFLIPTTNAGG